MGVVLTRIGASPGNLVDGQVFSTYHYKCPLKMLYMHAGTLLILSDWIADFAEAEI